MIVERANPATASHLALTSKYFALHCLASKPTFPAKNARFIEDINRIKFLSLLEHCMPAENRLCHICRIYRPINGEQLKDVVDAERLSMRKRRI